MTAHVSFICHRSFFLLFLLEKSRYLFCQMDKFMSVTCTNLASKHATLQLTLSLVLPETVRLQPALLGVSGHLLNCHRKKLWFSVGLKKKKKEKGKQKRQQQQNNLLSLLITYLPQQQLRSSPQQLHQSARP